MEISEGGFAALIVALVVMTVTAVAQGYVLWRVRTENPGKSVRTSILRLQ
jgi:hypothetical protein